MVGPEVDDLFFAKQKHPAVRVQIDDGRRGLLQIFRDQHIRRDAKPGRRRDQHSLAPEVAAVHTLDDFGFEVHVRWFVAQDFTNLLASRRAEGFLEFHRLPNRKHRRPTRRRNLLDRREVRPQISRRGLQGASSIGHQLRFVATNSQTGRAEQRQQADIRQEFATIRLLVRHGNSNSKRAARKIYAEMCQYHQCRPRPSHSTDLRTCRSC